MKLRIIRTNAKAIVTKDTSIQVPLVLAIALRHVLEREKVQPVMIKPGEQLEVFTVDERGAKSVFRVIGEKS